MIWSTSPDSWTLVILNSGNCPQIPWDMQAAHRLPLQGNNVIDLMFDASLLCQLLGLCID